ncbi:uncharacterized protein K441DRAFT_357065 [Cenococcum geophilum 1.58]|uniref:Uncharacterized protein n=1 Tax=Cenococcum geophilum 1.58 TaxID=794803 RepID=A0ACC8EML3_9PEZI|nr:hypothetical protein K441DRAFT_357065 [Cenococcum geophilum 1.58]
MSSFIKDKIKWGTSGFIGGPAQIQAPRSPSGAPQIPENYVRDMRAPNRRSSSRFEELNSSLTGSHSHSTHRTQQISDQREQTHDPERPYIVNHSPRSKPQKVSKAQPHVYGDHSIPSGRDPRKPGETVAYGQMIRAERQEPRRGSESSPVRGSRPPHKFPRESLGPRALNSDGATALALGSQNESEFDGRTLRGLFDGLKQTEEFQLRYPYYPYVVLHVDALDRGCERALESEAYLRREIGSMQRNMIALIERNHPHENIDEPDALKFILEQYQTRLDYCLKLEREGKEQFEAYAESIRRRDEIISDRDQEITKLRNQLSQEKLKCDLDLNSCESYYKQKIKHQETAHQQKLKDQKTAHQQQLEDQEYAYQHRLEGLKYAYQQQLEEQKTAHQQQLEDQKAAHQQQLEDQKAAHQQQLEGQKTVHQQQFKDQKAAHEKEISTKEKNMEDQRVEAHMKIQELNRLLITDADNFQPEPDDRFRATFDKLQKNVYLLAKKAKCELHVDREKLGADFDQISFARAVKERHLKLILETSFWRILREKIFLNPFHVFGELGESLFITWCKFFSNSSYPCS